MTEHQHLLQAFEESRTIQNDLQSNAEDVQSIVASYEELKKQVSLLQMNKSTKMLVDLGNDMFVRAKVDDLSKIFVSIGLGFFAELTLEEALQVSDRWIHYYTDIEESIMAEQASVSSKSRVVSETMEMLTALQGPEFRSKYSETG